MVKKGIDPYYKTINLALHSIFLLVCLLVPRENVIFILITGYFFVCISQCLKIL